MPLSDAPVRKIIGYVVVTSLFVSLVYPAVLGPIRGEPLDNWMSEIIVALLIVLLYGGSEFIDRLSIASRYGSNAHRAAIVALLTGISGICAVLIYAVPDSPAAIGLLAACGIGAILIVLFGGNEKQSRSPP